MFPRALRALAVLPFLALVAADTVTETDTGISFPASITIESGEGPVELRATGVGLREATFMKVNVYAAVSYVEAGADLGEDPARALVELDVPRRIELRFVRDVDSDRVVGAYREGLEKNLSDGEFESMRPRIESFLGLFGADAREGDVLVLTYLPGTGTEAVVNGEVLGVVPGADFARGVWSIWFGRKPVSGDLRRDLAGEGS